MIRAAMGSIARYAIYPIQDLLRRQSQTDQQEAQLSQTLKNMQSSSRRLAKLKRLQK